MIETLAAFHSKRLPSGPGVGAIFISGGAAGLVADLCQDLDVSLPELAPETATMLEPIIPEYGTVGNPLDTTGQAATQPEITEASLVGMAEDPNIHTVVYGQAYPVKIDLDTPVGQVIKEMPDRYPDKVFLIMSLVTGRIQDGFRWGEAPVDPVTEWDGVPFLQGAENSLRAIRSMIRHGDFRRAWDTGYRPVRAASPLADRAQAMVREADGRPLSERRAKQLLALYDLPVTRERLATSADEAVHLAEQIGYPVVLKIESPDILHKTEAGGVVLGLTSDDAVRSAFEQILDNTRRYTPDASINGVLVQEMAPPGREMILGMSQDPTFGPAVALGLGGIFVEVLKDVQIGVPPLRDVDARGMLSRLRGYSILEGSGARGAAPADVDELIRIVTRFSQLCIDLADVVSEIDINPLFVYDQGRGARVVDCLVVPKADTTA
jgi:acetate---CoA ligase (ADP-forming)